MGELGTETKPGHHLAQYRKPSRGPSRHGPGCSCLRCTGFQPTHGAESETRVAPLALSLYRSLLRYLRLRQRDLPPLAVAFLRAWARNEAKCRLMDKWATEHGFVSPEGELPAFAQRQVAYENAAQRNLSRFYELIKDMRRRPEEILARAIEEVEDAETSA
jgi:hypothetical protein